MRTCMLAELDQTGESQIDLDRLLVRVAAPPRAAESHAWMADFHTCEPLFEFRGGAGPSPIKVVPTLSSNRKITMDGAAIISEVLGIPYTTIPELGENDRSGASGEADAFLPVKDRPR